jgi:phospholipid/cholesterol/gamma-HCH transport system substrate-binding protein
MRKGSRFQELIVGVFVVGVVAMLAVFTIVISGASLKDVFGGARRRMTVKFEGVGGLRAHDNVIVRGVPVGQVERMRLDNSGVEVKLDLTQPVRMHEGYRIAVVNSSLLGGNYLSVDTGPLDAVELPPDTVFHGETPHDLIRDFSEVVAGLRRTLDQGGVLTNLSSAAASLQEVLARVNRGEGTLGRLLSSDDRLYLDLTNTVANLRRTTDRIERGEGTIGRLLSSDDRLYADLTNTVANLRRTTDRVERGEGTLGRLLSSDDRLYQDLTNTVANLRRTTDRIDRGEGTLGRLLSSDDRLYQDLTNTVANLRVVTERMEKGEGTLGMLSKDDALYKDLKGLIGDARQTLDGMRESTPVTTFSSIILGAF